MDISDDNTKLSIITVNYNNKNGLQKTIDSVISQTFREFEWIIIDGASTDGSKELIEQYADKITHWISEPDKGIYNAMNKGIKVANGEYLLFLNSGDYLAEKNVLCEVMPLLNNKDFYVGQVLAKNDVIIPNADTIDRLCKTLINWSFPHQAAFIHRQNFVKYGLYREDIQTSSDWWLFFVALVIGNSTISEIPFVISVYDTNGISSMQKEMVKQERIRLFSEVESSGIRYLCDFYRQNLEIIQALKGTSCFFNLFRFYFYFYRKWKKTNRGNI